MPWSSFHAANLLCGVDTYGNYISRTSQCFSQSPPKAISSQSITEPGQFYVSSFSSLASYPKQSTFLGEYLPGLDWLSMPQEYIEANNAEHRDWTRLSKSHSFVASTEQQVFPWV